MTVRTRYVKQKDTTWHAYVFFGVVLAGFYGALQLGHWLASADGGWMPGGGNPVAVVGGWVKAGHSWSGWNTMVAVLEGLLLIGALIWLIKHGKNRQQRKDHVDSQAKYLGDGAAMTLKAVTVHATEASLTTGDVVGIPLVKNVQTGQQMWAGFRETCTAIMGPGSGKTSALVVPACIDAPGPLWVTSNRNDVVALIAEARRSKGQVWVFDPQNVAGMRPVFYWDPLTYITDEVRAGALTKMFAEAGRPLDARTDAFFDPAGQQLLGNMMLAAKIGKFPITKVFDWLAHPNLPEEPCDLLRPSYPINCGQLEAKYDIHDKTKGSIFETAALLLTFLVNKAALPWVMPMDPDDDRPQFDPEAFVRSDGDTMICLSREGFSSFGPVVAAMTTAVIEAAERYATSCPGGRMPVPLVFELDEVANVCRIQILPDLMSHSGGRGLFITAILQSRAQGEGAWGKVGMSKLLGASTIRILGKGIEDMTELKNWSERVGPIEVITTSRSSSSGKGGGSRSTGQHRSMEPILTPAAIGSLPAWRCLVDAAGGEVYLGKLVPYFERKEMKEIVADSKAKYEESTGMVVYKSGSAVPEAVVVEPIPVSV